MKRASRRQTSSMGRIGTIGGRIDALKAISSLLLILALWLPTAGTGAAASLTEQRTLDAQIAPGVVDRQEPADREKPFDDRIHDLIPDAEQSCLRIDDRPRTDAQIDIAAALQTVRRSELGAWLVRNAAGRDVTVCLDRRTRLEAHYRSHLKLLGLSGKLGPAGRVVFLAHELAHVPQHPRYSNNRRFSPADMLLMQRVREAAAEAVATRVLWQLRRQGIDAPWRKKLATAYRDIAESFEAAMDDGLGLGGELQATRSAFLHWFKGGWRPDTYDDLMLKTLARIAKDPIGLIPMSRRLSDDFLQGIDDYAGQEFLIGGDGQTLIDDFRAKGLRAKSRARLEAILADAGMGPASPLPLSSAKRSPPSAGIDSE